MSDNVAIGIDLGTTFSCVAVLRNGRVDIIANDYGSRITPSWVAFTDEECLSGEAAKAQACVNPCNTVFEIKRLIGRRFHDTTVQDDIRQWPFTVFDDGDYPKIRLQHKMKTLVLTPEQVSSIILTKMRYVAESYLGREIRDAVITVPAYFNDSQRQATKDAGKIAGLNVLHILNEPTAAAIAYGFDKKVLLNQRLLVFDLGGGTLDVAVLSIASKKFKVAVVGGDTHLGGGDFDSRLVDYFVNKIKLLHGRDLTQSQKALGRLRNACENAKIKLSSALKAKIDIACLFDGKDFQVTITRKRFEDLCSDLFCKILEYVECVVNESGFAKKSIQEVILVGGSSRIPKIQEMLQEFFNGKKLSKSINFDEAVAYGASIWAAIACGTHTVDEITLAEVVPFSLGMKNSQGEMIPFIKRNSRIPTTVVQDQWTTAKDYADSCTIKVYEGERTMAVNNNFLGSFVFYHGQRVKKGVPKLTFTFLVDADGILHVSGENEKTKFKSSVTITSNQGRLSKVEIERMKLEAREYGCNDEDSGEAFSSKESLEHFCEDQMVYIREMCNRGLISPAQRNFVIKWCKECLRWLRETPLLSKNDYTEKLVEIKSRFSPALLLHISQTEGRNDYQSFKLC